MPGCRSSVDAQPPPLRPAQVRGVVFDLDGTLVDSYAAIACSLNHARTGLGLAPLDPALVRRRVGFGLEALIAELVGPQHVAAGVRLFRERYAEVFATGTAALPGAQQAVLSLAARGFRLAVASNKPARFSTPILAELGMLAGLACVAGPDIVGSTKPDPEMIRFCLRAMALDRSAALYVGDMPLDVLSAARAGVSVVLVAGGSGERAELEQSGQRVVESLAELPDLLPVSVGQSS